MAGVGDCRVVMVTPVTDRGQQVYDNLPVWLMQELYGKRVYLLSVEDFLKESVEADVVLISPYCMGITDILRKVAEIRPKKLVVGCVIKDSTHRSICAGLLGEIAEGGCSVLGPNSCGFFDLSSGLALCWSSAVRTEWLSKDGSGHVAMISQGAGIGFSFYSMARSSGVKFRQVVSLGDTLDDGSLFGAIEEAAGDPQIRLILVYLEALRDGEGFLRVVEEAKARGLTILVLRSGASSSVSSRISIKHAGVPLSDDIMWESILKQYGVVSLTDVQEMADLGKLYSSPWKPVGPNVAVVALSEDLGLLHAQACERAGLVLKPLSSNLRRLISDLLPQRSVGENPVSFARLPYMERLKKLSKVLSVLQGSDEVDMIVLATGSLSDDEAQVFVSTAIEASKKGPKLVVCSIVAARALMAGMDELSNSGVPFFSSPNRMALALSRIWQVGKEYEAHKVVPVGHSERVLDGMPENLSEREGMELVDHYGLSMVPQRFCRDLPEVIHAAREMGFPLVIKVVSPSFVSKSQARGVVVDIRSEEELRNAYGRILERVARAHPHAKIEGVFVQRMISDGVECMIGIKRDPVFGPVIAVALGGAYYQLSRDISLRAAPVNLNEALDMIKGLKGFPLLSGEWNGKALDVSELAAQVVKLSHMARVETDLEILDINPIFVTPGGVAVADAFAVRKKSK